MDFVYETGFGLNGDIIKRTDVDGNEAFVPSDPSNSDYAAYLLWLEAQTPTK